jgi:hypothetical protein
MAKAQFIEVGGEPTIKKIRRTTSISSVDIPIGNVPVQQSFEEEFRLGAMVEHISNPPPPPPPPLPPHINRGMSVELYNVVQYSKKKGKIKKDILASGMYTSCMKLVSKYKTSNVIIKIERA